MVNLKVMVRLRNGLQARNATEFVVEANRFSAKIMIERNNRKVDAKSILGLMSLAVPSGTEIILYADGSDEIMAVQYLSKLLSMDMKIYH